MNRNDLAELDDIVERLVIMGFYTDADALAAKIRARNDAGWTVEEYHEWMEAVGIEVNP